MKRVIGFLASLFLVAVLATPAQSAGVKYTVNQKTLASFSSTATTLNSQQRAQVRAAVDANPTAEKFICTGIRYYSQPMSVNIMVRKRAKAACEYAKQLNPALSTWYQNKPTQARSYAGKVLLTIKSPSAISSDGRENLELTQPKLVSNPLIWGGYSGTDGYVETDGGAWEAGTFATVSFQWYRCLTADWTNTPVLNKCTLIPGANSRFYQLTSLDEGHYFQVGATARIGEEEVTAYSQSSHFMFPISEKPPRFSERSQILGNLRPGGNAFPNHEVSYSGENLTFSYLWYTCDTAPDLEDWAVADSCDYAFRMTHQVIIEEFMHGKYLLVNVTATDTNGSNSKWFSSSQPVSTIQEVSKAPSVISYPSLLGELQIGSVLSFDKGQWTGTEPIELLGFWYRCTAFEVSPRTTVGNCSYTGQMADQYLITSEDEGYYIGLGVLASGPGGSTPIYITSAEKVAPESTSATPAPEPAPAPEPSPTTLEITSPSSATTNFGTYELSGVISRYQTASLNFGTWNLPLLTREASWWKCPSKGDVVQGNFTSTNLGDYGCRSYSASQSSLALDWQYGYYLVIEIIARAEVGSTRQLIRLLVRQ